MKMDELGRLKLPKEYICEKCGSKDGKYLFDKSANLVGITCSSCRHELKNFVAWLDIIRSSIKVNDNERDN